MKTESQIREMISKIETALKDSGVNQRNYDSFKSWEQKVYIRRISAIDYLKDILEDDQLFRDEY
jgi:hypothetical protein